MSNEIPVGKFITWEQWIEVDDVADYLCFHDLPDGIPCSHIEAKVDALALERDKDGDGA